MRERAYQFGGELCIKGYGVKGTEVTLTIPIDGREKAKK
jgi:signal transduction histidine kinase